MISFKQYINEESGETSINGKIKHFHTYVINNKGNGKTFDANPPPTSELDHLESKELKNHTHKIKNSKILTADKDKHIHKL